MATVFSINLGVVYVYLIIDDGNAIIVDSGFPGDEQRILLALETHNIARGMVRAIVITHADPDHYGSAGLLRNLLKVPVIVHQLDAIGVRTGNIRPLQPSGLFGRVMKVVTLLVSKTRMKAYRPFQPDITMDADLLSLAEWGIDGYLLHTPGETKGSISVVLNDGQIVAGDLIGGAFPHSARPGHSLFYEDRPEAKRSLQKTLALKPVTIYTGHSKPIDVNRYHEKLHQMTL